MGKGLDVRKAVILQDSGAQQNLAGCKILAAMWRGLFFLHQQDSVSACCSWPTKAGIGSALLRDLVIMTVFPALI
jgi:hypothetical protein